MTAIIGIKDGKRIMVGSDGMYTSGHFINAIDNIGESKVQRIDGSPNCLIACAGDSKIMVLVNGVKNLLDGKDDISFNYLVKNIMPKIVDVLDENNMVTTEDDEKSMECELVIATKSHLYLINNSFEVSECKGVVCCGVGSIALVSKYLELKDKDISQEQLIIDCLDYSVKLTPTVGYPLSIYENDSTKEPLIIQK